MLRSHPTRRFSSVFRFFLGAFCLSAVAQSGPKSSLPPTAPTANQIAPLSASAVRSDAALHARRAEVRYADGLLSINASNSSLNQILREIALQTGMKVTGGVREERVFGHYGPASPETILVTLLDGTGTNIVIRQSALNAPQELILTPRGGGPTPPNPNAPSFDNGSDAEDDQPSEMRPNDPRMPLAYPGQLHLGPPAQNPALRRNEGSVPPSIPQPLNNVNGSPQNGPATSAVLPPVPSTGIDAIPTPSVTPPANGIVTYPNPPTANTAIDPASTAPNEVKTPEQIFEQLQKLRQQQQQTTTPPK